MLGALVPFAILAYFLKEYDYDISSLTEYKPPLTTKIYDKYGEKIANIFEEEHRYYAKFDEIPPRVIEALLAIEDTTFSSIRASMSMRFLELSLRMCKQERWSRVRAPSHSSLSKTDS